MKSRNSLILITLAVLLFFTPFGCARYATSDEKITEIVDEAKEGIIQLTRELVSIPSQTGHEKAIIERLELILREFGFDEIVIDEMGNLVGRVGSGEKIVAIDGHVDTVAVDGGWLAR